MTLDTQAATKTIGTAVIGGAGSGGLAAAIAPRRQGIGARISAAATAQGKSTAEWNCHLAQRIEMWLHQPTPTRPFADSPWSPIHASC